MTSIGIMQGRLLPPVNGKIQAFPTRRWEQEFFFAQEAGLSCIEWIYEQETEAANPLRTDAGTEHIRRLAGDTNVGVWSVCADYYMTVPLLGDDGQPVVDSVHHLQWLIGRAGLIRVRYMVLPFVDTSSLRSEAQCDGLLRVLGAVIPVAEHAGVELHLETDLQPDRLAALLDRTGHPLIRANYDTGNSASLGYDPGEELTLLGPWLGSVHIKDRVRGGGTVPLGTGDTDFPTCFRQFRAAGFQGPFILQVAREEESREVELAKRNSRFVREQLAAAGLGAS